MSIGKRLKYYRELKGLSGRVLAQLVDLDASQISKIENDISKPSLDSLERICTALGITLAEFFADEALNLPPDLRQLIQEAKKMNPKQRKKLIDFIKTVSE